LACPALALLQECSIQISPISDSSCADPTDERTPVYGAIEMRGFWMYDFADDKFKIRSLGDTTRNATK